jgi:gag-polypeptide of LTR copia-type
MLALLDDRSASSRAASRIAVQTQLYRKTYDGGDMATFIDEFGSLFSQLERMGKDAAIPESHKAPMLLAAIPIDSPLEVTAAALRTKDVVDLTWEFVATTLIDENEARSMCTTMATSMVVFIMVVVVAARIVRNKTTTFAPVLVTIMTWMQLPMRLQPHGGARTTPRATSPR